MDCIVCGKEYAPVDSRYVIVHLRSGDCDQQRVTGVCSAECVNTWYSTNDESVFHPDVTELSTNGIVDVYASIRPSRDVFVPVDSYQFDTVAELNEWWSAPPQVLPFDDAGDPNRAEGT